MEVRWLGWAGVEIESQGARVVVDPLADAEAVFAPLKDRMPSVDPPEVVPPRPDAVAGLITHLHRDHADADALAQALGADAVVYEPPRYGGDRVEQAGVGQADAELTAAGLTRGVVEPWTSIEAGPFRLTALPAVDGLGDPQVSWLIEAEGRRVLHLGDTMFHGWWWRIAQRFGAPDAVLAPINGARVDFPHRRPASSWPATLTPEQAVLAAELLRAGTLLPIHYGGYSLPGLYEPIPDAVEKVRSARDGVTVLEPGEHLTL
jgi:L-ascorbate metabolism protein UlaG (beta-lactamase superfamily)